MAEVAPIQTKEQLLEVRDVLKQSHDEEGIFDLPDHPKMDYEDIFGEPVAYRTEGLGRHLHSGISKVFGGSFNYVQSTMYYILVMITGLFLSFVYGLIFGTVIYLVNWFVHPLLKLIYIILRLMESMYRPVARMVLDPVFQSVGQCFASVKAAVGVHVKGVKVDLTQSGGSLLSGGGGGDGRHTLGVLGDLAKVDVRPSVVTVGEKAGNGSLAWQGDW